MKALQALNSRLPIIEITTRIGLWQTEINN
ncbi:hypothetical protein ACVWYG_002437 [Pedobacter sp. UYEF25]